MLLTAGWALVSLPAVGVHHPVVDLAQAAVLREQCPLVEVVAGVWALEHLQLLPLDLRELQVLHHRVVLVLTISPNKTVVLLTLLLVLVHLLGQQVRVLLIVRMQALLR